LGDYMLRTAQCTLRLGHGMLQAKLHKRHEALHAE